MPNRGKQRRAGLWGVLLPLATCLGGHSALASDPIPGDGIAPPVDVNIGMFYNEFTNAGAVGAVHGSTYSQNTHISTDITVARYIRTFNVDGFDSGAQIYVPYAAFLGTQQAGIGDIASAAPGLLPAYGPGRANLSHESGFGQPNLGVFSYVINRPASGTYAVVSPWILPPISGFNKNASLNPSQNVWTYEMELGFRTVLLGTPATRNLALELWSETYLYGSNNGSADVSPEVSADNIPPIYALAHEMNPEIPAANPLQNSAAAPAKFEEQPTQEIRAYLPYEFAPAIGAFISPGFYQSFGGKQTYTLRNGEKIDSGNRTNETQLRLVAATFVSPTTQVVLMGEYDVAAYGTPLNRNVLLRITKFF
jgi:hypothetical protein